MTKKVPFMSRKIKMTKHHTLSKRNSGFTKSSKYMVSGARSQSAMDLLAEDINEGYCSRKPGNQNSKDIQLFFPSSKGLTFSLMLRTCSHIYFYVSL